MLWMVSAFHDLYDAAGLRRRSSAPDRFFAAEV